MPNPILESVVYGLLSASLAYLICFILIFLWWEVSGNTTARDCCFQDLFKTRCSIRAYFPSFFFSKSFVRVQVVLLYSSSDMTTVWKNSCFILSKMISIDEFKNPQFKKKDINRMLKISLWWWWYVLRKGHKINEINMFLEVWFA